MERMTRRQVTLSVEQSRKLRELSERSRVPAAVFVREGIDRVLDLAEKQMDTLERAQRKGSIEKELQELERTDPDEAEAARKCDQAVAKILSEPRCGS